VKLSAFHFGFENYPSLCLEPKSDPFMVNLHGEPHRMERDGQNHYGQNDEKINPLNPSVACPEFIEGFSLMSDGE